MGLFFIWIYECIPIYYIVHLRLKLRIPCFRYIIFLFFLSLLLFPVGLTIIIIFLIPSYMFQTNLFQSNCFFLTLRFFYLSFAKCFISHWLLLHIYCSEFTSFWGGGGKRTCTHTHTHAHFSNNYIWFL